MNKRGVRSTRSLMPLLAASLAVFLSASKSAASHDQPLTELRADHAASKAIAAEATERFVAVRTLHSRGSATFSELLQAEFDAAITAAHCELHERLVALPENVLANSAIASFMPAITCKDMTDLLENRIGQIAVVRSRLQQRYGANRIPDHLVAHLDQHTRNLRLAIPEHARQALPGVKHGVPPSLGESFDQLLAILNSRESEAAYAMYLVAAGVERDAAMAQAFSHYARQTLDRVASLPEMYRRPHELQSATQMEDSAAKLQAITFRHATVVIAKIGQLVVSPDEQLDHLDLASVENNGVEVLIASFLDHGDDVVRSRRARPASTIRLPSADILTRRPEQSFADRFENRSHHPASVHWPGTTYSSGYAFGQIRRDLPPHLRTPRYDSYRGPWYLPGSPTNELRFHRGGQLSRRW